MLRERPSTGPRCSPLRFARHVPAKVGGTNTALIGDIYLAGALGVFGLVNLFAGLIACCPLYRLVGINTHSVV